MSTRALIKIEGGAAAIYKHADGYPEGVLPALTKFRDAFWKGRGYDPHYFPAQYLMKVAGKDKDYDKDFLGWAILPADADAGQEYEYVVKKNGKIFVYEVHFEGGKKKIEEA